MLLFVASSFPSFFFFGDTLAIAAMHLTKFHIWSRQDSYLPTDQSATSLPFKIE